ncbi:2',3'-cyclic-nucleotide 2'-phosphodiesterase (5'-nucleotidase family) [Hypnocyclicus thermotrophus]|uniref:2',3'-cyclic-nucleotide 2'-phosphodiesterase (5'-nucleotidase family) n=1 Tax=Hypnocyclicus thermotrophus TaxID=1627895 RepID=A0AA46I5K5_9FUSO|nr:hypothetical protein [Hypnocyclicus thermotrophus]TDT70581.1 2',3'-cyclic-nucleotide 2'-phosphodiesterase (5'-nucleotidase family) [Hypnocyclicus thermotrophus]
MKKYLVIFIIMIFSINTFARTVNFSIISMGALNGEYKKLDSLKIAIDTITKEKEMQYDNVIKINVGNNMTEYLEKNDIMLNFYKTTNFNFNFLGKQEFLWRDKIDPTQIKMSTLNIIAKDVLPYQLMKMEDYIVCVVGITNIYEEDIKGTLSYKRELQNLMYMLEDNVDFLFVVTDLEREENVSIIQDFPQITGLFESRLNLYDFGVEKINNTYLIPTYGISVLDFKYDEQEDNQSIDKIGFKLKTATLLKRENILKPEKFGYDRDFRNYINWTDVRIKNENSLIIGYTDNTFNPYEIYLSDEVPFLDDLADKLMKSYKTDAVIFPKKSLLKGIKKGLYTVAEVNEMFTKEKFIILNLNYKELNSLMNKAAENRGNESYFYISGLGKSRLKENYKILSFENLLEDYKIDKEKYEVENIGIREYMIKK